MAVLLVLIGAIPAVAASFLIAFGARLETRWFKAAGIGVHDAQLRGWAEVLSIVARYVAAVGCVVLVTGLVYYFGPNRPMKLRRVWPGAFLATGLWVAATTAFGWYVRHLANYNVMYGSIAAVIVLLVWMYLLSVIGLAGCEFNAERERLAASWPIGRERA